MSPLMPSLNRRRQAYVDGNFLRQASLNAVKEQMAKNREDASPERDGLSAAAAPRASAGSDDGTETMASAAPRSSANALPMGFVHEIDE